jgi:hypothetical protein
VILYRWQSKSVPGWSPWWEEVSVFSRYAKPAATDQDMIIRVRTAMVDYGQTSLLVGSGAIAELHAALVAGDSWNGGDGQSPGSLRWEADGTAILSVLGYGHEWKRNTIRLPRAEAERLAVALADWLAHGWAGCTLEPAEKPYQAPPAPKLAPCVPTGSLADPGEPLDRCGNGHRYVCLICAVPVRYEWHAGLADWREVADDGAMFGRIKPPRGENGYEYCSWLGEQLRAGNEIGNEYSTLSVTLAMGGDPFTHRHRMHAGPRCGVADCVPPARPMPPFCHGQPLWLTGPGWQCRVAKTSFPFAVAPAEVRT